MDGERKAGGRKDSGFKYSGLLFFLSPSLRCKYANDQNKMQLSCLSECGAEAHTRTVGSSKNPEGALCVEMGFTWNSEIKI